MTLPPMTRTWKCYVIGSASDLILLGISSVICWSQTPTRQINGLKLKEILNASKLTDHQVQVQRPDHGVSTWYPAPISTPIVSGSAAFSRTSCKMDRLPRTPLCCHHCHQQLKVSNKIQCTLSCRFGHWDPSIAIQPLAHGRWNKSWRFRLSCFTWSQIAQSKFPAPQLNFSSHASIVGAVLLDLNTVWSLPDSRGTSRRLPWPSKNINRFDVSPFGSLLISDLC